MSRSWVAHAVDDARTVSTPSSKVTGSLCSATSDPTTCGQRPITDPTLTSGVLAQILVGPEPSR